MGRREVEGIPVGVASLAFASILVGVASGTDAASPEVAGAAVLLVGGDRYRTLGGLVGSIATGALVGGALAWLATTVTGVVSVPSTLATGLGLAVGGGLGSVVWLIGLGDEVEDGTETVTVDMEGDEAAGPAPEPVDLFEASPDPICFYSEAPEGPVVRAVNPAFTAVFGVSSDALDGVPLREGVLVAERADDVVAAAREGRVFDEVVACETDDGRQPMRVRIAATGRGRTDGYVLYTAVEDAT